MKRKVLKEVLNREKEVQCTTGMCSVCITVVLRQTGLSKVCLYYEDDDWLKLMSVRGQGDEGRGRGGGGRGAGRGDRNTSIHLGLGCLFLRVL